MQGRNKKRFEGSQIGQSLVLFQAADLTFAVANLDGEVQLGEVFATAEIFEQIAKGLERFEEITIGLDIFF